MTLLKSTRSVVLSDASLERVTLPSPLDAANCMAAWNFWTLKDSTANGRDLTLNSATLEAAGALVIGSTTHWAAVAGLTLPSAFSFVASVYLSATGTIFGNSETATSGFRIYATSTQIMAKLGDDAGRSIITPAAVTGWMELGVSYAAGALTLCDATLSATSTDSSPLGSAEVRFGRQVYSSATAAAGKVALAAVYNTALSVTEMRALMAVARTERLARGYGA